ncbi:MAG TPA: TetR family transcriptional regulator [Solirubrobacteraceae bacterium]|jgi:AcrR family transcriptional regulator
MVIPPPATSTCWADLSAQEKHRRLLLAAGEVFAREGLDAPMPAIAAAAGAGVGSVYRQFPSKHELLAALVALRLREIGVEADGALAGGLGPWSALTGLLWGLAERQAEDDLLGEAMATVSEHEGVQRELAETMMAIERLLDAARAEGKLRADASTLDVRLLLTATRAAGRLEANAWRRMLELGIDALEAP